MFELTPGKLTSNSKKAVVMPTCEHEVTMAVKEARFYDPDLGRFLQVDPARENWSLYLYSLNNPVIFFDPNSENAWDALKGVPIGVGKAGVGMVKGVYSLVRHPVQTVKGIGESAEIVYDFYSKPERMSRLGNIVTSMSDQEWGEFLGGTAFSAFLVYAPFTKAKGVGVAGGVAAGTEEAGAFQTLYHYSRYGLKDGMFSRLIGVSTAESAELALATERAASSGSQLIKFRVSTGAMHKLPVNKIEFRMTSQGGTYGNEIRFLPGEGVDLLNKSIVDIKNLAQ
ncbi:MAG: hypothetical protein CSA81_01260 [Acidobacteria bacterium]|nr:MAG: hypothetical protein CSA81_01260 [Acidobacteriota bacterium]